MHRSSLPVVLRVYMETLMMVAIATAVGALMAPGLGTSAIDLLYLIPVITSARLFGLRPALFAGLLSALAYNFFFTEPLYSFRIEDPHNVVTVLILFSVAFVTSQLASRMRAQERIAAANAERNATLAGYARRLISCTTPQQVGEVTCTEIASLFECNAMLLIAQDDTVKPVACMPSDIRLNPNDIAAAAWVVEYGEPAGRGSAKLFPADWIFYPVRSQDRNLGALGLARDDGRIPVAEERLLLLHSLMDQTALALERLALEANMLDIAQLRDRDRLRGALLSSVGHDLRTPLTAIIGAAAELRREVPVVSSQLIDTIEGEAGRLGRYIANLLDMTRIEAGAIKLRIEPADLIDAVAAAVHDLRTSLANHSVTIDVGADLPLVLVDPQLLHHCLINLLDNAARYSPPHSNIIISAIADPEGVILSIADEGAGLPADGGDAILERFIRISGSDRKGGTGLGLAIVSGFAQSMGICISAANRKGGKGAIFALRFPPKLLIAERDEGAFS